MDSKITENRVDATEAHKNSLFGSTLLISECNVNGFV